MKQKINEPLDQFFVKSKITGGHYAFKTSKSNKPFSNKMTECKSIELYENDVVVDIGAYVGEYSLYALRQGIKKVISYEATPRTFKTLTYNVTQNSEYRNISELHNKAVVGGDDDFVNLYISSGIGVTNSITKTKNKAGKLKVPAVRYEKAVREASVVKIDVEGAEYSYNIIQDNLRAIILEFHPLINQDWQSKAFKIMNDFKKAGFKSIMNPKFANGWDMAGSWVR